MTMSPATTDRSMSTGQPDLLVTDLLDVPARDVDGLAFMCRCRAASTGASRSATAPASVAP